MVLGKCIWGMGSPAAWRGSELARVVLVSARKRKRKKKGPSGDTGTRQDRPGRVPVPRGEGGSAWGEGPGGMGMGMGMASDATSGRRSVGQPIHVPLCCGCSDVVATCSIRPGGWCVVCRAVEVPAARARQKGGPPILAGLGWAGQGLAIDRSGTETRASRRWIRGWAPADSSLGIR